MKESIQSAEEDGALDLTTVRSLAAAALLLLLALVICIVVQCRNRSGVKQAENVKQESGEEFS